MTGRIVRLRSDDRTIADTAVDLADAAAVQLHADVRRRLDDLVTATIPDVGAAHALLDASTNVQVAMTTTAALVGFFLGLTPATHGPLGDRDWLAEALRLSGEDAAVVISTSV